MESDPEPEESHEHAPEPWSQEGRYIRDATGAIVVRGRSSGDARRIVAAINGTIGIPTEALESWTTQDVSDPQTRPDLELEIDVEEDSPFAVPAPRSTVEPQGTETVASEEVPARPVAGGEAFVFERRVFQRRLGKRRIKGERRRADRRRPSADLRLPG